ncbi:MAG: hypothetical protein EAX89_03085 [Candidatus Lokiarchaeota archaeon]|nr:hypothetical protein [Candidatus Lokiarchaeota archaeon]
MNSRKKVELISEILDRYDDGVCLYCGSTLNGDMEEDDWDEGYSDDWCPICSENIDPNDDWDEACIEAIDKVIHDEPFKA